MKKSFRLFAAVLALAMLTACGVSKIKEPITVDRYREVSEQRGLTVDIREGEASTTCNGKSDDYSSQFYVFDNVIKCDAAYEYLISQLVTSVTGDDVTTEKTETEYKKCIVKSTTVYNVVIQLQNTLLYVYTLSEEQRGTVDEYIVELGY